jgi:hypothetical protein
VHKFSSGGYREGEYTFHGVQHVHERTLMLMLLLLHHHAHDHHHHDEIIIKMCVL